ncbi:hypothetical protein ISS06_02395 [Patescibacteria group bacterium]|nr:hypothetical protein [Patescibacteria group bacterium]
MNIFSKYLIFLLIFLIFGWYCFLMATPINLTNSDIGRHLKNGELVLEGNKQVMTTSFYSYTNPTVRTINHHWATGVLFFWINKLSGFSGISIVYLILSLIIFGFSFILARQYSNNFLTIILSLLIIPILVTRTEVRPEVFSYLFSILFIYILLNYRQGRISYKTLFLLPILQILWVNLHVFFFLGPLIVLAFWLEELILPSSKKKPKILSTWRITLASNRQKYGIIFIICYLAQFVNPFFYKGVWHPFYYMVTNYGYKIIENQSIWFMDRYFGTQGYLFFKIIFLVALLSFLYALIFNKKRFSLALFFLMLGFSFMAWIMNRNISLFGFFALPVIAFNIGGSVFYFKKISKQLQSIVLNIIFLIIILCLLVGNYNLIKQHNFGIGLMSINNASIDFWNKNNLKGPIFNNYDVGGYLIYHLYPIEKVFVDNRPASYPNKFFQDTYIPMQSDEATWQAKLSLYDFNSIFFFRRDITPWAQKFLISRINDSQWAPVFVDSNIIIFLRKNNLNKKVIDKYEIPQSNFKITYN